MSNKWTYQTPVGGIEVIVSDGFITQLNFVDAKKGEFKAVNVVDAVNIDDENSVNDLADENMAVAIKCEQALADFFAGKNLKESPRQKIFSGRKFGLASLPVRPAGSEFQTRVWQALQQIPLGQVVTYAQLAQLAGRERAARAVGNAVGANPIPIIIPCHRVVASAGLGGFSAGLWRKVALLRAEEFPLDAVISATDLRHL